MKTVGERLGEAIRLWDGGGIMAFVTALSGIRGGTYPAVKRYVDGETEPSLRFLDRAATILGVDFGWLAIGTGEEEPPHRETIKVRAAVAINPQRGEYFIKGDDSQTDEALMKTVGEIMSRWGPIQVSMLTAEIPIHEVPEIQAEVEG